MLSHISFIYPKDLYILVYRNPHGQLNDNLFLALSNTNFISKFEINAFEINAGKTRDILILQRITYFSTIGSVMLKRRNNGRKKTTHFRCTYTLVNGNGKYYTFPVYLQAASHIHNAKSPCTLCSTRNLSLQTVIHSFS